MKSDPTFLSVHQGGYITARSPLPLSLFPSLLPARQIRAKKEGRKEGGGSRAASNGRP